MNGLERKQGSGLHDEVLGLDHLPPLTAAATRLIEVASDPELEIKELAEIIEQDPPLTARILGLANSAFFGQKNPILTVEHAIIRVLGLNMVRSLSLSMALAGSFDTSQCDNFKIGDYWLHALVTSTLAAAVGRQARDPENRPIDSLYLGGLLHSIGILVLVHVRPIDMSRVFEEVLNDDQADIVDLQRTLLGIDQWQAGEWLGFRWHLPEVAVRTLAHITDDTYTGRHSDVVAIVRAASRWAHDQINNVPTPLVVDGLSPETASAVETEVRDRLEDLRKVAAAFR
jgi:HD-like signal output (HDOD) protein